MLSAQTGKKPAWEILGNPEYQAICYGGYRESTRDKVPSVEEIKEDLRILAAMGIKIVRTYNTQQFAHASNLLEAIAEMQESDPDFEMYVMLGAWIDCKGAWTANVDHADENLANNTAEVKAALSLAQQYPNIVRIIAVGNEAMVRWAGYHVRPGVITKWVNYLKKQREAGELSNDIWITTSDNFAAWGGGDASYHTDELRELVRAVDYVSMHTYPFHDTHHNPSYWIAASKVGTQEPIARSREAMDRAIAYARKQYEDTKRFVESVDKNKLVHIGETGWASEANALFGENGSGAADEFKAGLFYRGMRRWTNQEKVSCFYFEMFDEPWKDATNPGGPENHFGLIDVDGGVKYALWPIVGEGKFNGLSRSGRKLTKTYDGSEQKLFEAVLPVPSKEQGVFLKGNNAYRTIGEPVTEEVMLLFGSKPDSKTVSFPSSRVKLNVWEGSCSASYREEDDVLEVIPGEGTWWGCAFEVQADVKGENLSAFEKGKLHFEVRTASRSKFALGFQTGLWAKNTQTDNFITLNDSETLLSDGWQSYSVPLESLSGDGDLTDVTSLLYLRGDKRADSEAIQIRRVYYTRE